MELFDTSVSKSSNRLPYEGEVYYHDGLLPNADANHYFDRLMQHIEWRHDEAMIYGKHIVTKRKVAWYGDSNYEYTYSKRTKHALHWTEELLYLKKLVQSHTGKIFNSCLLNLYHNGDEGMTWHSDDEKSLGKNTTIASLSLGAARKFCFKHKNDKKTISLMLEHGSLLTMKGATQTHWLHSLPKSRKISRPRINLTFRTIVDQG